MALEEACETADCADVMFLKTYLELPLPFLDAHRAMVQASCDWSRRLPDVIQKEADRLLLDVDAGGDGGRPGPSAVEFHVGSNEVTPRTATLAVGIDLDGYAGLPTSLTGSLDAAWLGPDRTQLSLSVLYEPPDHVVGGVADRALLHRMVETLARALLEAAVGPLAAQARASRPSVRIIEGRALGSG